MAAAFMLNDTKYALELIDSARLGWEANGCQQERESLERHRKMEMEVMREADVWFQTKDGLMVKQKIGKDNMTRFPPEWKRQCMTDRSDFMPIGGLSNTCEPIRIRIYRREENAKDGRPIYREQ